MAKVKFGIEDIHLHPLTDVDAMTYAAPIALPGGVSITLNVSEEDPSPFYADDGVYYLPAGQSSGYDGDLEVALFPDEVKLALMAYVKDAAGVMVEVADAIAKPFGMTFSIPTDEKARKLVYYRCQFGRPGLTAKTTEGTKTPQTETAKVNVMPSNKTFKFTRNDEEVEAKILSGYSTKDTDPSVYANWHKSIHLPAEATASQAEATASQAEG